MDTQARPQLFFSELQFRRWGDLLLSEVDDVMKEEYIIQGDGVQWKGNIVSQLECSRLQRVQAPVIYQIDEERKPLKHMFVVDCVLGLCWKLCRVGNFGPSYFLGARDVSITLIGLPAGLVMFHLFLLINNLKGKIWHKWLRMDGATWAEECYIAEGLWAEVLNPCWHDAESNFCNAFCSESGPFSRQ